MNPSTRRAVVVLTALALLVAPVAFAVSLYDVIQLSKNRYRENQIIGIIEATDSRFQVDADTVITLKREGVPEKVIEAIVSRSDGAPADARASVREEPAPRDERWRTEGDRAPAAPEERPQRHDDAEAAPRREAVPDRDAHDDAGSRPHEHPAASNRTSTVRGLSFNAFAFAEEGSGHHEHVAVALGDVPILIVRAEAGFRSTEARAAAIADSLNRALARGAGVAAEDDSVILTEASRAEVLRVSRGDVVALRSRSAGRVDAQRTAVYWASLIQDYLDLARGDEPARLAGSGIEAVRSLFRGAGSEAAVSSSSLSASLDRLPPEERQELLDLARGIPVRFRSQEGSR